MGYATMNPNFQVDWWFLDTPATSDFLGSPTFPYWNLRELAYTTDLLRDFCTKFNEISAIYIRMIRDCGLMRAYLKRHDESSPIAQDGNKLHRARIMYAIMLATLTVLNFLLQACTAESQSKSFVLAQQQMDHFAKAALQLAKQVQCYRPLGAAYIPVCLTIIVS
jgi:hypothetical protein